MYEIKYSKQAVKALRTMPKNLSAKICNKIEELAEAPFTQPQVKALKGTDAFRLRVGDWRIVYSIEKLELEIWIIKIASRGKIYQ